MSLKDILSPFVVWKRAFEKPYTSAHPLSDRPGADRYRGFHQNDMSKCIGCGSCEAICQNAAIDMIPVENIDTTMQDSGLRPKIDYGRCCWCALCVDICTTDSLQMSNDYIWVDTDGDAFRFIPGADAKKWDDDEKGYSRSEDYKLLLPDQVKMPVLTPDEGVRSFIEVVKGYSKQEAMKEAERCVECGLCVASCPAHMDIPEYIRAIREDNLEEALQLLYKTNPMPATCGRICTHLCEGVCSVGVKGEPLAIRWLKRYIVDQIDPSEYREILHQEFQPNGKKIAIIGAGPGGLSAAYYLITAGYAVTIFEQSSDPGGMIRYGVPEYRMPYDQLDKDIDHVKSLGVEIKTQVKIGKDLPFERIYNDFDAVFFSTGLPVSYQMEIPGEDLPGVKDGLQILREVTDNKDPELGEKVVVIGGGNTAMDAARTARRKGAEVTVVYRRRLQDMPADKEEIEEALAENVQINTQGLPLRIEKAKNHKLNFVWNNAEMVDQGDGKRPRPVAIEGDIDNLEVDTVIRAIGQGADFDFIPEKFSHRIHFKRYKILLNEFNQTTDPKVFAGGDIANDKADAISAIADGHKAAIGIDKFLNS